MGFVLMGRAMLSKSLIQFSVDEQGCVPSLLFPMAKLWMVAVMMVMATSFLRAYARTVVFSVPDPAAGHRQPMPLPGTLDTHRKVWLSHLWGHSSFLLGPDVHKVLFVPSKSLFPQFHGSSVIKSHCLPKSNFLGAFSPFARSPGWEIWCASLNFHNSERTSLV